VIAPLSQHRIHLNKKITAPISREALYGSTAYLGAGRFCLFSSKYACFFVILTGLARSV